MRIDVLGQPIEMSLDQAMELQQQILDAVRAELAASRPLRESANPLYSASQVSDRLDALRDFLDAEPAPKLTRQQAIILRTLLHSRSGTATISELVAAGAFTVSPGKLSPEPESIDRALGRLRKILRLALLRVTRSDLMIAVDFLP